MKKNRIRICGKNTMTLPTPAITPSIFSPCQEQSSRKIPRPRRRQLLATRPLPRIPKRHLSGRFRTAGISAGSFCGRNCPQRLHFSAEL